MLDLKDEYNNTNFPLNKDIMQFVKEQAKEIGVEVDESLLKHLGFLYMRDAMVIFKEKVQKIDENSTEHFEVNFIIE